MRKFREPIRPLRREWTKPGKARLSAGGGTESTSADQPIRVGIERH